LRAAGAASGFRPRLRLPGARLLDWAALGTTAWLGGALLFWSGRSATFWTRPEHVFLFLLGIASVRLLVAPAAVPQLDPRRVLAVGVALYAFGFSFVTVTRHFAFRTHALDLGYYVQLTWNLARGHGPSVSLPEMNAWGDHLSPIMYLFVPAFWLAPGPMALLVGQAVALAAGAVAVFGIARHRLGDDGPAAAFAILYLLNPSLHGINVRDFHAAALAIPLLLAALYFAEVGRHWLFLAAALLTLMCREDAALAVVGLGAWLGLARRRWLAGAVTALGAFTLLAVDLSWVIPHFRHEPYAHLWRYAGLGHSLGEVVATMVVHPVRTLEGLLTGGRLIYLAAMLAPLGFLPLGGGWDLVGALPALAENLLSSDPILYNYRTQYQSFVLPFLLLAGIGGYSRLVTRWRGRQPIAVLGVAFALSLGLASPALNDLAVARWWPDADQRAAYAVLARVPAAASISAQERYVPHLGLRHLVTVFPVALDRADYVLVNERAYPWRDLPDVLLERTGDTVTIVAAARRPLRYEVAARAGPHLLLHRLSVRYESPGRAPLASLRARPPTTSDGRGSYG
jgi:uncharacterized membrane protein